MNTNIIVPYWYDLSEEVIKNKTVNTFKIKHEVQIWALFQKAYFIILLF